MSKVDHLALAKEDLAIAESGDAKREAYKRAAAHVVAHKKETGDGDVTVATVMGCKREKVRMLVKWAATDFAADTPWLADTEATNRAARSHANKVLREEPEVIAEAIAKADRDVQRRVAKGLVESTSTERSLRDLVDREPRQQPAPDPERKVADGAFLLWEAGELLMDEVPDDASRVRIADAADRAALLAAGIKRLVDTGEFDSEFEELVTQVRAER